MLKTGAGRAVETVKATGWQADVCFFQYVRLTRCDGMTTQPWRLLRARRAIAILSGQGSSKQVVGGCAQDGIEVVDHMRLVSKAA